MTINIKTRHIIVGILLSLFLTFSLGGYLGYLKQKKVSQREAIALRNEIQRLTVEIGDKEYNIARVEQELKTERELRKQDIIDKETLKALNIKHVKELTRLKLRIDTLLLDVANSGEVIVIKDTVTLETKNAIKLPFSFQREDEWLSLRGDFNSEGVLDISLKMDVPVDIYSAIDKKTKMNTVYIATPNKYIETLSLRSYKTDVPKPKRWGFGLSFGYAVYRNGSSPFVGISLNYNILRF